MPVVVIGVAIVFGAIVVPRYPRPTFVPEGIVAGTGGSGEIDPLYLSGSYAVTWTLEPAADTRCRLDAGLYRADDGGFVMQLVTATTTLSGEASGIDSLPGARYIIKATSECKWRVMFDPRPEPE